jgi:hypothetical protein
MTDADKVKRYEQILAMVAALPDVGIMQPQRIVDEYKIAIDHVRNMTKGAAPPELLKLYYIYHNGDDGNDHTMFLRATSPEAAYGFWKDKVAIDGHDVDPEESIYVRTVPPAVGRYGKVDWGDIVITTLPDQRGA